MRMNPVIRGLWSMGLWCVLILLAQGATQPGKRIGVVIPHSPPEESRWTLDELFMSGDVPRSIPDGPNGVAESFLDITSSETIRDLNVLVTITHPWLRDLRISLIAPGDTTEVLLLDLFPADSAADMINCWFDDQAVAGIYEAHWPITGVFRPLQPLGTLNGRASSGRWTLLVRDRFPIDTGRIEAWGIEINPVVNLRGTVRDAVTQTGIPGVTVDIVNAGRNTTTNSSGTYEFSGVPAGVYTLRFRPSSDQFRSTQSRAAIPDQGQGSMTVVVGLYDSLLLSDVSVVSGQVTTQDASLTPASGIITDINVTLNITHSWVGDLALLLSGPTGVVDTLVRVLGDGEECASRGANLVNCTFDDEATRAFTSGTGPFTGSWQPFRPLSQFDNTSPRGPWRLTAIDQCPGDSGFIENVTLHFAVGAELPVEERRASAKEFSFDGNFPNPFNSQTEFRFSLAVPARVELKLYNLLGQEAAQVANSHFEAGIHCLSFSADALPSGLYFARFSVNQASEIRKAVLIR